MIGPIVARVGPWPASGKPNKFIVGPKQVRSWQVWVPPPQNEANISESGP